MNRAPLLHLNHANPENSAALFDAHRDRPYSLSVLYRKSQQTMPSTNVEKPNAAMVSAGVVAESRITNFRLSASGSNLDDAVQTQGRAHYRTLEFQGDQYREDQAEKRLKSVVV